MVLSTANGQPERGHENSIKTLAISSDNRYAVTTGSFDDNSLLFWNITPGEILGEWILPINTDRLWLPTPEGRKLLVQNDFNPSPVLAFSTDCNLLAASLHAANTVDVYRFATPTIEDNGQMPVLAVPVGTVQYICSSPN